MPPSNNRAGGRSAIFSDVHGHLAGLQAVFKDAANCRCDRLICLGDVVDGGDDNIAVARSLRDMGIVTLRGSHDEPETTEALALPPDVHACLVDLPEKFPEGDVL